MPEATRLPALIAAHEHDLVSEWQKAILASGAGRHDLLKVGELQQQCREVLEAVRKALVSGNATDVQAAEWTPVRDLLATISRTRAAQGFNPSDVARFVFALKQPLFAHIRKEFANDPKTLGDETWSASTLVDTLGLYTMDSYLKVREEMIRRQQEEMLELSTPVVKLWDGILALPLIGTLDSARTQVVMETLLQKVVQTGCEVAIIDIIGVPMVDILVAQHLLKTVTAA
ncbi:MAG TPA: STAS domain-containing protein, partial [Planctomycetota bacterium]|nr:STAS domain-containing protein [Planctomycetota bacterium]